MRFSQRIWLARYYARNALLAKLGGYLTSRRIERHRTAWDGIRRRVGKVETVLVVGNGPSLDVADLEALGDLTAIASNRIYLAYDRTDWRPTLYTICDPLLAHKHRRYRFPEVETVLCSHTAYHLLGTSRKLPWLNLRLEDYRVRDHGDEVAHPVEGLFEGFSITVQNIQLALWLGARRIILLGCDHSYEEAKHDEPGRKLVHGGSNHFDPRYRQSGEIVNNAPIVRMTRAYEYVKALADRHGCTVLNASRVSYLEAFAKVSVEDVLEESEEGGSSIYEARGST